MAPREQGHMPRRAWQVWLHAVFLIRPGAETMTPLFVWAPLALISMTAAAVVAFQQNSLADLWLVREWLRYWLAGGDPFTHYLGEVDYPPTAFFVLWPLALPGDDAVRWLFVPLAIITMAAAGFVLLRWLSDRAGVTLAWYEQAALVAMLLSGGSARGGIWRGQTAALAVLLGALALYWSRRRPVAAAVTLAMCAYKPHIALGFALAIFFTERRAVVWWAGGITVAMWGIFAASVEQSLAGVLNLYTQSLFTLYDGPDRVRGLLSIRFVIEDFLEHYERGTVVYAALALITLTLIGLAARRRFDSAGRTTIAAACLLWPLLFLPNQLYHGVLAWPAIWLLMWPEVQPVRHYGLRMVVIVGFITFSVLDVPRTIRIFSGPESAAGIASYYLSPLRLALVLGLILNALRQPHALQFWRSAA
ncbi:MAG: glycosyltransferase family 87 protein [Vicinamibacterales bacterium]